MFETTFVGRPKPAERTNIGYSKKTKKYFLYTPRTYQKYQQKVTDFFNQFQEEQAFSECFDPKKIKYGLSVKLIFRRTIGKKNNNPFLAIRPDIDNLYKAVTDGLFNNTCNLIYKGYKRDKAGNIVVDDAGNPFFDYKQKIDDCRIVHIEVLKLQVYEEEEEGFTIKLRNIGKDDIE